MFYFVENNETGFRTMSSRASNQTASSGFSINRPLANNNVHHVVKTPVKRDTSLGKYLFPLLIKEFDF